MATEVTGMDTLVHLCAPDREPPRPAAMMVLAHPDDETVGCASLLRALTLAAFVYVTDGSPRDLRDARAAGCATRDEYASMRRGELLSALESAGISADRIECVDCVDQETSTQLVALTLWLEILIREHAPDIVLTHPYEGGHPDHDSAAFAVHSARRRIAARGQAAPILAEFASYHLAWMPDESGTTGRASSQPSSEAGAPLANAELAPERTRSWTWEFGMFLRNADPRHVLTRTLSPSEITLKRRLLGCYASQREVLRHVPLDVERFRIAPDYDFTQPPHEGVLLYEQFPWGVTGAEWRRRAGAALRALENLDASPGNLMRATVSGRDSIRT